MDENKTHGTLRVNVGNLERLKSGWRVNFDCENNPGMLPIRTIQLVIDDGAGISAATPPYTRGQVVSFTVPLGEPQGQASSAKG